MKWSQIKDMADKGHEIISLGEVHTNPYTNLSSDRIIDDLKTAQEAFEENAGVTPVIMAYPEGNVDQRVKTIVSDLGYKAAFTLKAGTITSDTDRLEMPRYEVTQEMLTLGSEPINRLP